MPNLNQPAAKLLTAILAGGEGRRFGGVDKALIELGGRRLIDIALARAATWASPVVISARRAAPWHAALAAPVVLDNPVHAGPLAGVMAAINWAPAEIDVIVTVTVDCPHAPDDLAPRLADAARAGGRIAVAASASGVHYLMAAWPRVAFQAIAAAVTSGETAVHRAQAAHGAMAVTWSGGAADPFVNLNTPADLNRATEAAS